jgi:hypothetical protein
MALRPALRRKKVILGYLKKELKTKFAPTKRRKTHLIVRPTKKPTNLSQSGDVPKGGRWMSFWKEVFRWKGGGEGCLGFYRFTFFGFSCFGLFSCTLKGCDFVPIYKMPKVQFLKGT